MKVAVIGAGPAGLMAAGTAAKNGHKVTIFDSNEKSGKKLYITGKGRCNVTNYTEPEEFLKNVVTNPKFLFSSVYSFTPYDTYAFFEANGVPLKIERGNRVFPQSDKASDITKALENFCKKSNVDFQFNKKIEKIEKSDMFGLYTKYSSVGQYDCVICCGGGKSYPTTGSDGSLFDIAQGFGHNIVKCHPALVPIVLNDQFVKTIEGLSLKNVSLNVDYDGKSKSFFGEMLFTKNGISGPIVLTASSYINKSQNVKLSIDFKPALTKQMLEKRFDRDMVEYKNNEIFTFLKGFLPKNFVPIFIDVCKIQKDRKVKTLTTKEIDTLVDLMKNFPLNFKSLEKIEYGIVTSGGIDTKEINPQTMESKLVKNLYFAGEIIDVDALTGGFNIQIALSTGFVAGSLKGL